jgi:hypothetical protein
MDRTYYQQNREYILRQQRAYFKTYYAKNKLEINARNSIRARVRYLNNKKYEEELKALMALPTADFIQLEEALKKNLKTVENNSLKTKKPRKKKVKEQPPRFSYAKGNFILCFD